MLQRLKIMGAAGTLAALLVACIQTGPRIGPPSKVEPYCTQERTPRMTAIESIVASVADQPQTEPVAPLSQLRKVLKQGGGVIAHWDDLLVMLPKSAPQFGSGDQYVHVHDVVITNEMGPGNEWRHVYMQLNDRGTYRWHAFRAYDIQNVCVEGQRLN